MELAALDQPRNHIAGFSFGSGEKTRQPERAARYLLPSTHCGKHSVGKLAGAGSAAYVTRQDLSL